MEVTNISLINENLEEFFVISRYNVHVLRAHGILGVLAWIMCASIATVLARYKFRNFNFNVKLD